MSNLNKRISIYLAGEWLRDNATSLLVGILAFGGFVTFSLNTDLSTTEEVATVVYGFNTPDKYSATDSIVVAQLADGKTINLYLPSDWIRPTTGNQIRVKRITRLFFGERFVLLAQP